MSAYASYGFNIHVVLFQNIFVECHCIGHIIHALKYSQIKVISKDTIL